MKCSTKLCGNTAVHFNQNTREYKCKSCREKRFDRHSLAWYDIYMSQDEEDYIQYPKPKIYERYSVLSSLNGGTWLVCDSVEDREFDFESTNKQEAENVCELMNRAFRNGVLNVLDSISSFEINVRRKHGL